MADLIKYLPDYYENIEEFIALTDAENPDIDEIWDCIMQTKNNQFIITSDEKRISHWEKLLNIRPDTIIQDLDYRKAVVVMRLSTKIPLTHRWLDEKLSDVFGEGNYVVTLNYGAYKLAVRLTKDESRLADELYSYLRKKIPANLCLTVESFFKAESGLTLSMKPYISQVRESISIS